MLWYFESYEGLWESTVCLKPLMGQAHSVNLPSWCEIFPLLPTAGAMGDHRGDASLPPSTVWTASEERPKASTVGGIKTNDRNLQHANMQPLGSQQCIPVLQWKMVGTMIKLCPDLRMQPHPQLGGWLAWRVEYLYIMGVQKKKVIIVLLHHQKTFARCRSFLIMVQQEERLCLQVENVEHQAPVSFGVLKGKKHIWRDSSNEGHTGRGP